MRKAVRVLLACTLCGSACFRAPVPAAPTAASRSVFSDSVYHASMCEAPRPNETWRTTCQPKDQRAVFALPKDRRAEETPALGEPHRIPLGQGAGRLPPP